MALTVIDASVVIGFLDAEDEHHEGAVAAFYASASDHLVLPATAYAEVLVAPARKGTAALARVEEALSALTIRLESVTPAIARAAAILRARHRSLRLPDALVLASTDVLDAAKVLTADRAWRKISRKVSPDLIFVDDTGNVECSALSLLLGQAGAGGRLCTPWRRIAGGPFDVSTTRVYQGGVRRSHACPAAQKACEKAKLVGPPAQAAGVQGRGIGDRTPAGDMLRPP